MKKAILLFITAWLTLLPVAAEEPVRVVDAWARASILASRPGAAYVTIKSTSDDRLLGATSPVADRIMFHTSEINGDISQMKHLNVIEIRANQPINLAPGGMHLMLMGLHDKLKEGATFPLTLKFEGAGTLLVEVSVLGIAALGPRKTDQGEEQ